MVASLHSTINILIKTEYEEGDPEKRFHAQGCVDSGFLMFPIQRCAKKSLEALGPSSSQAP